MSPKCSKLKTYNLYCQALKLGIRNTLSNHANVLWFENQKIISKLFFFLNIYLFIMCEYTVAFFRCTRREHQILLWVVVNHHVVAGIWIQDLRKSSQYS
jgi:ABC-type maltose transport system permease subunit